MENYLRINEDVDIEPEQLSPESFNTSRSEEELPLAMENGMIKSYLLKRPATLERGKLKANTLPIIRDVCQMMISMPSI